MQQAASPASAYRPGLRGRFHESAGGIVRVLHDADHVADAIHVTLLWPSAQRRYPAGTGRLEWSSSISGRSDDIWRRIGATGCIATCRIPGMGAMGRVIAIAPGTPPRTAPVRRARRRVVVCVIASFAATGVLLGLVQVHQFTASRDRPVPVQPPSTLRAVSDLRAIDVTITTLRGERFGRRSGSIA
jgi:hypothetical protein